MAEVPEFGAMLASLLGRREVRVRDVAASARLNADGIRAVLSGESPSTELVRRLASALGFHAVDLLILAGLEVPSDLEPLDPAAELWVPRIVTEAVHLKAAGRGEVLHLVRSLPQEERTGVFVPQRLHPLSSAPGNRIIRMLRYRNLSWSGLAKTMAVLTPTYLAASTFGRIGADRKELTPRLVIDFSALLGIEAGELAAMTGVVLPGIPPPPPPEAQDAAALLWEARRLSAEQAEYVAALARSMRGDSRNGYTLNLPGS
ncbi:hypothetical protein [Streptomyces sp. NPDC049040]|uniref:hypothetical protein n=1 Tax=Streptomyces sp. NPDC049040 TaxID=3365593 RepID=UPI0037186BA0